MFIRPFAALCPRLLAGLVLLVAVASTATVVSGQEPPPKPQEPPARPEESVLPPVVVTAPPPISSSSEVFIPGRDFELMPQGRPADVLRLVPGFVISQHQGGGKAEQYFLRGFDADHGTDIALFIDGLPSISVATLTARATPISIS
jgi:outer membrane cobalamin receptor